MYGSAIALGLLILAAAIAFPIYVFVRLAQLGREIADLRRRLTEARPSEGVPDTARPEPPRPFRAPAAAQPPAPRPPIPVQPAVTPPAAAAPTPSMAAPPVATPPAAAAPPAPPGATTPWYEVKAAGASAPPPPPPAPPAPTPVAPGAARPDLESVLGANWLAKLGIVAIAVSAAFFLKYAFDSGWIGPTARVAIGLAGAAALLGLGQFLLTKPVYRAYAQVLSSGGVIILFLSVFAAYSLYHLIAFPVAFAVLALAALAASALAAANNTEAVALLCIAGAFATPALIRENGGGTPGELTRLYAYLAGLNLWSVILARYRPWPSLIALSFGATWLLFFGAGRLHGPNYLVVEAFAVIFLFFACYSGIGTMKSKAEAEPTPPMQRVGVALILIGCVAFAAASVFILAGEDAFGLPALVCVGVLVAVLLSVMGVLIPDLGVHDRAVRDAFRYLSAAALALLIGASVLAAPVVMRAQATGAFLFGLFIYLVFLGVALHMRRAAERETPAAIMLAVNVVAHMVVAFHALAPVRLWGIHAAPLWLPVAGWITLGAVWLASRQKQEGRDFRIAAILGAQALPLVALVAAVDLAGGDWPAALGSALFFGEFLLVSLMWVAMRDFTAPTGFRGDLLAAFGNAAVFFGLVAATARLTSYQGLVLLCGWAIAFAAYHALVGAFALRRPQDDRVLRFIYLGLALTFITIAIPLQLKASYVTVAWAVESAVLVWTGLSVGDRRLRWYGVILLVIAADKALFLDITRSPEPFRLLLNTRMLSGASVIAAAYISAWLLRRQREAITAGERPLPAVLGLLGSAFTLIFVSLDLWDHFGAGASMAERSGAQQLALTAFWCAYAVVLLRVGLLYGSRRERWLGIGLLSVAAAKALFVDISAGLPHFRLLANDRMLSGASVIAASYVAAWLLWRERETTAPSERPVPPYLALLANAFTLIFVSLDLWDHFGAGGPMVARGSAQQLALSIFWSVYALATMSVGIWRRIKPVRLFAMGLLYISIVKVFVFDLGSLAQPYRIISFFGLGVILLVVSLLYTRFEGRLR